MADKTWKKEERTVAGKMRTKRNPLSGSRSGNLTSSDSLSPDYYIETKLYARAAVLTLFEDVRAKARKEGKIPVLVMRQKGKKHRTATIDFEFLCKLLNMEVQPSGTD